MNYIKVMFDMQLKHNQTLGRDTLNDPNKGEWFPYYKTALMIDCMKLIEKTNWDYLFLFKQRENIKEMDAARHIAVNCFTRYLSMLHIYSVQDVDKLCADVDELLKVPVHNMENITFHSIGIINECSSDDCEKALVGMFENITSHLGCIFKILDQSPVDVFKIYNRYSDVVRRL